MFAKRMLFVLACSTFGPASAAPVPKEKPLIRCELKLSGKIGDDKVSDGGEVTITNISPDVIDIGTFTSFGPASSVDLKITDPGGKAVELEPLRWYESAYLEIQPHLLKPGESFRCEEQLLTRISEEKRVSGIYKVRAVFMYKGKNYESTEVEVKCVKEKPTIRCELKFTGKIGESLVPDGAEVLITNISNGTIDIGTKSGPLGLLEIKVKDPKRQYLKTVPLAYHVSPFSEVEPNPLKPSQSHRDVVLLLPAVPEEKRIPGTYKVKVVLTYQRREYESNEVEVKWPVEKK